MMQQAELPLSKISIVRNDHGEVVIASWGVVILVIRADTLDDVRRALRKRGLEPHDFQHLILAVAAAGVVQPDATAAPF